MSATSTAFTAGKLGIPASFGAGTVPERLDGVGGDMGELEVSFVGVWLSGPLMEEVDALGLGGGRASEGDRGTTVGEGTDKDCDWLSLPSQTGTAFLVTEMCLTRSGGPVL